MRRRITLTFSDAEEEEEPRADHHQQRDQELVMALRAGEPGYVARLLDAGANANAISETGDTVLHMACDIADCDAALVTASLLLDKKALTAARRQDGGTPLFLAASRGHHGLTDLLLAHGPAEAHALREDGSSAVFAAARAGHVACVQSLLSNGASANLPRHDGATPLLIATISSQPGVVRLLCGLRADPTPTFGGLNALGWASEKGDDESGQALIELHMVAEEEQRAAYLALRALQGLAGAKNRGDATALRAAMAAAAPHAVALPALAAELAMGARTLARLECEAPPAAFCCPITQELLRDPVFTADGHTYERHAIVEWLREHETSPNTGAALSHKELTPNIMARGLVSAWLQDHPQHRRQSDVGHANSRSGLLQNCVVS